MCCAGGCSGVVWVLFGVLVGGCLMVVYSVGSGFADGCVQLFGFVWGVFWGIVWVLFVGCLGIVCHCLGIIW